MSLPAVGSTDDRIAHGRRGASWTLAGLVIGRASSWVVTIIVARTLGAAAAGVIVITMLAYGGAAAIRDQSVSAAVAFTKAERPTLNALFAASLGFSLLVALLYVVAAPVLQARTGVSALGLCAFLAGAFIVSGAGAVPAGILGRSLRFGRLAVADTSSTVVFAAAAAVVVLWRPQVSSVGVGQLFGAAFGAACVFAWSRYLPGLRFALNRVRGAFEYQAANALIAALSLLFMNIDTIAVAASKSGVDLGRYTISFNAAIAAALALSTATQRVVLPSLTAASRDGHGAPMMVEVSTILVVAVSLPIAAITFVIGPQLVTGIFGDEFTGTAAVLRVLSVYGLFAALASPATTARRAAGDNRTVIFVLLIELALGAALLLLLTPRFGLPGAAASVTFAVGVGTGLLCLLPHEWIRRRRLAGLTVAPLIRSLTFAPAILLASLSFPTETCTLALALGLAGYGILVLPTIRHARFK